MKLDTNVLKCIKCAVDNKWDIGMFGVELIKFVTGDGARLPLCFEYVAPLLEQGIGGHR